jgi:WD40 repeat protein
MSPEQARGEGGRVDVRSDVFSLGAILYLLLVGRPAHDLSGTPLDVLRQIGASEVRRPRLACPALDADIEALLMRSLALNPEERYPTVAALAGDIQCYLAGEPLSARRATLWYLARRRFHRYRWQVGIAACALGVLIGGAVTSYVRISLARNQALVETKRADGLAAVAQLRASEAEAALKVAKAAQQETELQLALSLKAQGDALASAGQWLEAKQRYHSARLKLQELGRPTEIIDFALTAAYSVAPPPLMRYDGHHGEITCTAFSGDMGVVVSGGADQTVRIWDLITARPLQILKGHSREIADVAVSPDGRLAFSGSKDCVAILWDLKTGEQVRRFDHGGEVLKLAFSEDGTECATTSWDGRLRVWRVSDGKAIGETFVGSASHALRFARGDAGRLAFGRGGAVCWMNIGKEEPAPVAALGNGIVAIDASPTGDRLLIGRRPFGDDRDLLTVSDNRGITITRLIGHHAAVRAVRWSDDGLHALSAADDGLIKVWDVTTGVCQRTICGDETPFASVSFSADGRFALSGDTAGVVKLYDLAERNPADVFEVTQPPQTPQGSMGELFHRVTSIAPSPDGQTLLCSQGVDCVTLRDAYTGAILKTFRDNAGTLLNFRAAVSRDGRLGIVARCEPFGQGDNAHVRLFDLEALQELPRLPKHPHVRSVAFCPSGGMFATADGGNVNLYDSRTNQLLRTLRPSSTLVRDVSFVNDGRQLVSASCHGEAFVWDVDSGFRIPGLDFGMQVHELNYDSPFASLPHGEVMFGSSRNVIVAWSPLTGRTLATMTGHTGEVRALAVSPHGRWLASAGDDGVVRIWDARTYAMATPLSGHSSAVCCVAWSPDGRALFSGSDDATIRRWDFGRTAAFTDLSAHRASASSPSSSGREDASPLRMASWYTSRGQFAWSASLLQRSADIPDRPDAALLLGRLYTALGQHADAIREFRATGQSLFTHQAIQCLEALLTRQAK